jgi:hypothetical protein
MKNGNIKHPNVGPGNGGNLPSHNTGPQNGGNLPTHNVGDAPGSKGTSDGPMKDKGSYANGSAPGTVKAK